MINDIRKGPTGYQITTESGQTLDLADIEVWEYLRVTSRYATLIAEGFPEYWKDMLGGEHGRADFEEVAQEHRQKNIAKLGTGGTRPSYFESPTIGPRPPDPFQVFYVEWRGRWRSRDDRELDPNDARRSAQGKYPKFITTDIWAELAGELFISIHRHDSSNFNPAALQATSRKRQSLPDDTTHVRGPRMADQPTLEKMFSPSPKNLVRWGHLCYEPETAWLSHFCVSGMQRTGKTTLLKLLFQSLYTHFRRDVRFVLYDAKPDLLPCLFPPGYFDQGRSAQDAVSEFYLLNPFDDRCTPWNIAADAPDTAKAREIANVLFPEPSGRENQYFHQASRDVATAVMSALREKANAKGGSWTFYELLCALQPENIETVLTSTPHGQQLYDTYLAGGSTAATDLRSTLRTKTALYLPAAYCWHFSLNPPLSITSWAEGDTKSIILANDHDHPDAITEVNRILLNVILQRLLAVREPPARTFLYLDEFEHLGRIDRLITIGEMGASRRINLALAFHDIDLLEAKYGKETAGILGMCGFFAFLKVQNPATAQWASRILGTSEVIMSQTTRRPDSNQADSIGEQRVMRPLVMPDEIANLRIPRESGAVQGYFVAPPHDAYAGSLPAAKLFRPDSEVTLQNPRETNYYPLWPQAKNIRESSPELNTNPPEDTFEVLYKLGFHKPGYQPQHPEPPVPPEVESAAPPHPETDDQPSEPPIVQRPRKKDSLQDYDFDFDFGDD